jgi:hypothetical protein
MNQSSYEFKKIMMDMPENYKIKSRQKLSSLTDFQILACLKIFIEKDVDKEGLYKVDQAIKLIREEYQFTTSEEEIKMVIKSLVEVFDDKEDISNEKINFQTIMEVVSLVKREKLFLQKIGNNLNYFIFIILAILLVIYINTFYSYKAGLLF